MPSVGHGGPGGSGAPEKAKNFGKTLRQLLSYLKDYKLAMFFVVVFAIGSTVLTIVGPKILGNITTEIFNGLMRKILIRVVLILILLIIRYYFGMFIYY